MGGTRNLISPPRWGAAWFPGSASQKGAAMSCRFDLRAAFGLAFTLAPGTWTHAAQDIAGHDTFENSSTKTKGGCPECLVQEHHSPSPSVVMKCCPCDAEPSCHAWSAISWSCTILHFMD